MYLRLLLEQDGPQDAKTGDDGEKFRMSERQRVRGTAVDSYFCESRGNLVSNTVMPPFIQKLLTLQNPFASFVCFAVRYPQTLAIPPFAAVKAYKFCYKKSPDVFKKRLGYRLNFSIYFLYSPPRVSH